jgi:hypothetical protein
MVGWKVADDLKSLDDKCDSDSQNDPDSGKERAETITCESLNDTEGENFSESNPSVCSNDIVIS